MSNKNGKQNSIHFKLNDVKTSLNPEYSLRRESCPNLTMKISEKLDNSKITNKKEYKIGNYLIKNTLGKGNFAKVKFGIYLPTGEKVAIKILLKNEINENDDKNLVKREFDILAKLYHINVIFVEEIFETNYFYYNVMEYCERGDLDNYIIKNRRLFNKEAAFFYFQLINGLEYIHSLGIVHRDLKPANLLLTKEYILKIIDFGLSNYFKEGQKKLLSTLCGSPCYASPEMIKGENYNGFKIDIWSTGIILYNMLCGYLPFEDNNKDILFQKIMACNVFFPKYIKKDAKDLIEKTLVVDPEKRIDIKNIKNHPFYLKGKEIFESKFNVYETKPLNESEKLIDNNKDNEKDRKNSSIKTSEKKEKTIKIQEKTNIENNKEIKDIQKSNLELVKNRHYSITENNEKNKNITEKK